MSATPPTPSDHQRESLEAAVYRRLINHLRDRHDVQNIDLMSQAGFCRNCLSRWYREAAESQGHPITDAESREIVYGMPFKIWKERYQTPADPDKIAAFQSHSHKS